MINVRSGQPLMEPVEWVMGSGLGMFDIDQVSALIYKKIFDIEYFDLTQYYWVCCTIINDQV